MNVRNQEEREQEQAKEGHQLLNVSPAQAGELPDNQAYLDRCSMVSACKNDKYLREIETVSGGIKINCNAGAVMTDKRGKYGGLNVWYIPDGIANIFSMHKLERCIVSHMIAGMGTTRYTQPRDVSNSTRMNRDFPSST
jgi:hypothetical protein